jgi:hypothetical protein
MNRIALVVAACLAASLSHAQSITGTGLDVRPLNNTFTGTNAFGQITATSGTLSGLTSIGLNAGAASINATGTITGGRLSATNSAQAGNGNTIDKSSATGQSRFALSGSTNLSGVVPVSASSMDNGYGIYFEQSSDISDSTNSPLTGGIMALNGHFGGNGVTLSEGPRNALLVQYIMQAANSHGINAIALSPWISAGYSAGGSNLTSGAKGFIYAMNPQAILDGTATNYAALSGGEVDVAARSGTSVRDKDALRLVRLASDAVGGDRRDTFINMATQTPTGIQAPVKTAIDFGGTSGPWPFSWTGTLFKVQAQAENGSSGPTGQVRPRRLYSALDVTDVDFTLSSGFPVDSPSWSVDGNGVTKSVNATITPTATGADLDVIGSKYSSATIANGGGGGGSGTNDYYAGDIVTDTCGNKFYIDTVSAGAVTGFHLLTYGTKCTAAPGNPVLTSGTFGLGFRLNETWATSNTLRLNPSGGAVIIGGAGSTVASLFACGASTKGARTYVTDATAPTYLGALTGGGTVVAPVFCNGTAWVSG